MDVKKFERLTSELESLELKIKKLNSKIDVTWEQSDILSSLAERISNQLTGFNIYEPE